MAWRNEVISVVIPLAAELIRRSRLTVSTGTCLKTSSIAASSASWLSSQSSRSSASSEGGRRLPRMTVGCAK